MMIDAHAHAAGRYLNAKSIKDTSIKFGLDKIVLCPSPKNNLDLKEPPNFPFLKSPSSIFFLNRMMRMTTKSFKDFGDGNKYVYELKKQAPEIIIQFLWVNPLDPNQMSNLEKSIDQYGVKGLKLHQVWDPFTIDGHHFNQLVEIAQAHHLPIFIHLYSKRETQKLFHYVGSHQDVTFIVAHMLGLDIFKEKCKNLANVYFDTSGSERVRGIDILDAINLFGHEHVIFGSDTPYARLEDQIEKIDNLKISDEVKESIFRSNIENVLSLKT
jgi:predicted TIM-barrel fold metal-dependent hydrolase